MTVTADQVNVCVRPGGDKDSSRDWQQFLERASTPALPYSLKWATVLKQSLGHRCHFLEANQGGRLVGVLPLAFVKSPLFGKHLVSLPVLNYGGPVVDTEKQDSAIIETMLIDRAVELADKWDVNYLELRNTREINHPSLCEKRTNKVLMHLELPKSEPDLWNSFKAKVRNQIRTGQKNDLSIHWGKHDLLADFYTVFSLNMRDLGTPVFSRRLFALILEQFSEEGEICSVRAGGQPVAAALILHGPAVTEVPFASSLRSHNSSCANMLMYYHLLARSVERGQAWFDFGRSSEESGTYRFKRQWGAIPKPSIWQYYLRKGTISDLRPDNPKHRWKIEAWKKLPLWVTRMIGPPIVRGIP